MTGAAALPANLNADTTDVPPARLPGTASTASVLIPAHSSAEPSPVRNHRAASAATLGFAPSAGALAALWFATGLGSALVWAGINTLAVEAVPGNRAGGTSVVSAFKFAGNALAPVMWLPLYHADPRLGFLGAGVMAALTGAFVVPLRVRG